MVFETERFENILLECIESRNDHQFQYILDELRLNPNRRLKCFDGLSTFEKILTIPNSRQFIEICVCNGCDFYKKSSDGIYPLHYAIHSYCTENLMAILKQSDESFTPLCEDHFEAAKYSAIINEKSDGGNNYLHMLGNNIAEDNFAELSKMIMAMLVNGCNVNLPNEQYETPFYLLLKNPIVDNNLLNFIIDNVRVDYYTHNSKDIHTMMEERGLAARMGKKIDFTVDTYYMVQHLGDWNATQLLDNLERWKQGTKAFDDEIMELFEVAIVKNLPEAVAILMELGPEINGTSQNSKFNMAPGFLACKFGHHQVLKVLLRNKNLSFQTMSLRRSFEPASTERNLLHQIFSSESIDPVDRQKTFDLIISDRRCTLDIINQPDAENRVPLSFACQYECDDIVKELLRRGAYIGYASVLNNIKKDTLEGFLDECVKCSGDINERECEIYIDYKFLMPPDTKKSEITPAHLICANSNLKEFILHPVIASFVMLKWRKIDFIVYFNLLVYFSFLIFLGYIIVNFYNVSGDFKYDKEYCRIATERHDDESIIDLKEYVFKSSSQNTSTYRDTITHLLFENLNRIQLIYNSTYADIFSDYEIDSDDESDRDFITAIIQSIFDEWYEFEKDEEWKTRFRQHFAKHVISYWFGIFGLTLMAIYEIVQFAMSYKSYFFKPINWLDILLIGFSFFVLIKNVDVGRENFKHITAIMILLMGAQSVQLFSKVSAFSLSLHMAILNKVCRTFLKTIAPYLIIISAFGMSFFALNHDDYDDAVKDNGDEEESFYFGDEGDGEESDGAEEEEKEEDKGFSNPFLSTISTVKMMLSDFGAVTIKKSDHFQGFLFLAFMVSISVVLFNLLNALAISDTNEMMEVAEFVETKKRISTLRSYESLFSFFKVKYANVFPKLTTIMLTPNKCNAVKVKRRVQIVDEVTILMQKSGKISNFEYLYADWMFCHILTKPLTFDEKLISKVLDFIKSQQQKDSEDMEKILNNQELHAIRNAQEDIYKELLKISSQYEMSKAIEQDGN